MSIQCSCTWGALLFAVIAIQAEAQAQQSPTDIELLLQRLEAQNLRIQELEARLPAVSAQPIAYDYNKPATASGGKAASSKPTQSWFGRMHMDYWAFPNTDSGSNFYENGDPTAGVEDRALFRRARFGVRGTMYDTMEYKLAIDFASPSSLAFKDAYIGFRELPFFQTILIGNQKRPYGLDALNSSRFNVFLERPWIDDAFVLDSRRLGVEAYTVSADERFNWRYGAFLTTDIQKSGASLATEPGVHRYQGEFAGRLANTIWYDESSGGRNYAHWAISGTAAFPDGTSGVRNTGRFRSRPEARTSARWLDTGVIAGADAFQLLGLEGVVNVGPFQVVSEYMNTWVQRDGDSDLNFHGAYAYISYFLTGEHMPWSKKTGTLARIKPFNNFRLVGRHTDDRSGGWGAWQVAARYSYIDMSDGNILGGEGESFTFGLNWYWTPYSRMQFNYVYGDIENRYSQNISSTTGLPSGAAGPTEGNYSLLGVRFMVDW